MAEKSNLELTDDVALIIAAVNNLKIAVSNLASKKQLSTLSLIRAGEIKDIKDRLSNLEGIVGILQKTL